jgi:hypothetical protein
MGSRPAIEATPARLLTDAGFINNMETHHDDVRD